MSTVTSALSKARFSVDRAVDRLETFFIEATR